jgi:uncharacterized RDD family membrane protein YckC
VSELVTGEAVVLGLRPARLPSRALAVLVDLAVAWGTYLVVALLLMSAASSMDAAAMAALSVALFILVQVGIPIVIETLSHGRSLGKLMCGLRVVREDGGPIRFRHALVRGAMGAVEIVLTMGVVASVASLVSARGRRLGDVFAGTVVIRERIPAAGLGRPGVALSPPPPWLAAQLAGLDLSRVPDSWWLTVRQYLARMRQLDPQVSWTMAGRLAGDLRGFTGVAGPIGAHPAAYLAAVVGERQAREAQRAFGAPMRAPERVGDAPGVGGATGGPAAGEPWVAGGVPRAAGAWSPPAGVPVAGGGAAGIGVVRDHGARYGDGDAYGRGGGASASASHGGAPGTGFAPPG